MQVCIQKIHYKLDKVNEYIQAIPISWGSFFYFKKMKLIKILYIYDIKMEV